MQNIILQVPLVGQQQGYDRRPSMMPDSRGTMNAHGHMACWYASACMVSYYFRPGPRLGLPSVWRADNGLNIQAIDELARVEGLEELPKPRRGVTRDFIAETLATKGPIWAAVHMPSGHAIALTGLVADTLHYNDPWEPARKTAPFSWFSSRLYNLPNALLVKSIGRS
jgi:hypothetical protein